MDIVEYDDKVGKKGKSVLLLIVINGHFLKWEWKKDSWKGKGKKDNVLNEFGMWELMLKRRKVKEGD